MTSFKNKLLAFFRGNEDEKADEEECRKAVARRRDVPHAKTNDIQKEINHLHGLGQYAVSELEVMRADRDRQKRRADELFAVIEKIEKERDLRWNMFLEHSREHHQAQVLLETALTNTRVMAAKAIQMVNGYRIKEGQQPLKNQIDLEAAPIGTAAKFAKSMAEKEAQVPNGIDAKAARDAIPTV